jgi:hypothetical protein
VLLETDRVHDALATLPGVQASSTFSPIHVLVLVLWGLPLQSESALEGRLATSHEWPWIEKFSLKLHVVHNGVINSG